MGWKDCISAISSILSRTSTQRVEPGVGCPESQQVQARCTPQRGAEFAEPAHPSADVTASASGAAQMTPLVHARDAGMPTPPQALPGFVLPPASSTASAHRHAGHDDMDTPSPAQHRARVQARPAAAQRTPPRLSAQNLVRPTPKAKGSRRKGKASANAKALGMAVALVDAGAEVSVRDDEDTSNLHMLGDVACDAATALCEPRRGSRKRSSPQAYWLGPSSKSAQLDADSQASLAERTPHTKRRRLQHITSGLERRASSGAATPDDAVPQATEVSHPKHTRKTSSAADPVGSVQAAGAVMHLRRPRGRCVKELQNLSKPSNVRFTPRVDGDE